MNKRCIFNNFGVCYADSHPIVASIFYLSDPNPQHRIGVRGLLTVGTKNILAA